MSGTVELPPEESTLLRASRGLGVAFWAVAIANGLYMIFTLRSQSFWPGLHNLCAGLLLVLVASASGVWEERRHRECPRGISPGRLQVKAMRSRLDESEGRCLKVGREFFLAGMYFVVAGFLSSPSTASEPQDSLDCSSFRAFVGFDLSGHGFDKARVLWRHSGRRPGPCGCLELPLET
eukprot:s4461_g6.t1